MSESNAPASQPSAEEQERERKAWIAAINAELADLRAWANREAKRAGEVEAELQQAREEAERRDAQLQSVMNELDAAESEVFRLRGALAKYGHHLFGCPVTMTGANDCYCGLEAALKPIPDTTKEK
jgi:chromosome segregation ATPase